MIVNRSVYEVFHAVPVIVRGSGVGVGKIKSCFLESSRPFDRACVSSGGEQDGSSSAEVCVDKSDAEATHSWIGLGVMRSVF